MTHQQIIDYCMKKPGSYLDYPFGPETTIIKIRPPALEKGRIFAQVFMLRGEPCVTLNCRPDSAEFYRTVYPGTVTRGWHCPPVQQPHFNTITLNGIVPDSELLLMIDHAFDVVLGKFPKYIQKQFMEDSTHGQSEESPASATHNCDGGRTAQEKPGKPDTPYKPGKTVT